MHGSVTEHGYKQHWDNRNGTRVIKSTGITGMEPGLAGEWNQGYKKHWDSRNGTRFSRGMEPGLAGEWNQG